MKKIAAIAIVTVSFAIGATACGASGSPSPSSSPQSCLSMTTAWSQGSGMQQFNRVSNDLTQTGNDATAGDLGAVQADATTLANDSKTLLGNLPPSCVPNLDTDLTTALNDFIAASGSIDQGSPGGIQEATQQMTAGGIAIQRATADLTNMP